MTKRSHFVFLFWEVFPPKKRPENLCYAQTALEELWKGGSLAGIFGYGIARSPMTDRLLLGIPLLINIY